MSQPIALPRAILFDWDNTLVDTWPTIHDALNHTLAAMEHPLWTPEETRARVRASLRDSFPAMFGDRWTEARDIFYARFAACHLETLTALPGAAALLAQLAGQGIWLGVVSNKTGRYLREEAAALGWDRWFGSLVGAQDAVADKPDRAPVDLALRAAGVGAGPEVWFVGDTAMDLACAHASNCVPVLVGEGHGAAEDYARCPPRHRASDLHELARLLNGSACG